jgi:electron transport complex protein RnfG
MERSTTPVANPSYRQRVGYHAGLLGGVCFLVSVLILLGHSRTQGPIAQRLEEDRLALLQQVLPHHLYDNNPLINVVRVNDPAYSKQAVPAYVAIKKGETNAVAFESMGRGYSGDIRLIVGLAVRGEILGVRVISHTETPGLGDKIELAKDPWITTFNGRSLANTSEKQWHVRKDGGDFDQFTGATITPRAVVAAVHKALLLYQNEIAAKAEARGKTDGQTHL